ncbi:MAG: DNA polymerase III subunit gamma/tau [Armatimonadetes bacterium]|nr:DNA polymerase III subunit gamma/tau [Armatimonadota bacterium]
MSHVALYRKYRSQTFGDLVGQEHVVKTLQNAIAKGKIGHSYLFTGPRGTGKTSTARLLAKALNCEKGPAAEPCNECQACTEITANICMDVLEMDAASESGVDDVREGIVEVADYQPTYCRYRVYIIDEVHDLSRQAFDALLKTIEEPPPHVVFILATTEFAKVPPTIRSRCQRHEFHRGSVADLVKRLKYVLENEGLDAEPSALSAIARMSDGAFRDALTLLEQAILTTDGKITLQHVYDQLGLVADETVDRILTAVVDGDVPKIVSELDEVYRMGRDPRSVLESLLMRLSDLTRANYGVDIGGLDDSAQEAALKATAASLGVDKILSLRATLAEAHRHIRDVSIPRIWLEAELVRVAHGKSLPAVTVPAEPSAAPREAKPAATAVPEAPKAKPEAPKPAPVESEPQEAEPTDDPALAKAREQWRQLVTQLGTASPVARERLGKARLDRIEGNVAMIEVSAMVLELVQGSKLEKGVREAWAAATGGDLTLDFFAGARVAVSQGSAQVAAVELPAEGERLAEMVREVFGSGARSQE